MPDREGAAIRSSMSFSKCVIRMLSPHSADPDRREFRLSDDMYAQDSIELLKQSGIDFAQNEVGCHFCGRRAGGRGAAAGW